MLFKYKSTILLKKKGLALHFRQVIAYDWFDMTNITQFFICLIVCNGDETKPCFKFK
jgi:hypothetical protein